jgi:hypothetical protein
MYLTQDRRDRHERDGFISNAMPVPENARPGFKAQPHAMPLQVWDGQTISQAA